MKFGQAPDIDKIDYAFPDDPPITEKVLGALKPIKKGPVIYTGCAKWGRKDWIGKLYPPGTKEKDNSKVGVAFTTGPQGPARGPSVSPRILAG